MYEVYVDPCGYVSPALFYQDDRLVREESVVRTQLLC
jgi:hypothetical protein